ncbi:hypothetical protein [Methylocystis sp. ATCC 49242]|uniref:hypothetical protein n=1 Tax=Methylocystis sp. ATCC 49242 TaxID=622637 RepID=UPI001185697F|nr:hypothetical protein [Methylocystis sp. ATCC 49242]
MPVDDIEFGLSGPVHFCAAVKAAPKAGSVVHFAAAVHNVDRNHEISDDEAVAASENAAAEVMGVISVGADRIRKRTRRVGAHVVPQRIRLCRGQNGRNKKPARQSADDVRSFEKIEQDEVHSVRRICRVPEIAIDLERCFGNKPTKFVTIRDLQKCGSDSAQAYIFVRNFNLSRGGRRRWKLSRRFNAGGVKSLCRSVNLDLRISKSTRKGS